MILIGSDDSQASLSYIHKRCCKFEDNAYMACFYYDACNKIIGINDHHLYTSPTFAHQW